MADAMSVYAGKKYGKQRRAIVSQEAKKQGFRSLSDFVWNAIHDKLSDEASVDLMKLDQKEQAAL
jgi:hypothetical protein